MTKKHVAVCLIMLSALSTSTVSWAYCENLTGEIEIGNEKKLVRSLLASDRELLNAVPRLSPKEELWLDGELNSGPGSRRFSAFSSTEYEKRSVRQGLESRVNILESLEYNLSQNGPRTIYEIYDWTALSRNYLNSNFFGDLASLVREGVMGPTSIMKYDPQDVYVSQQMVMDNCSLMAVVILDIYVLPKTKSLL